MSVCFVTCRALRDPTPDDGLAAAACRARGMRVEAAPWEDRSVAWESYDAIVVRSAWTYHLAPERFGAWLDRVGEGPARVFNRPDRMRWNAHKDYLFDLARDGVAVIPSTRVEEPAGLEPGTVVSEVGSPEVVVKPFVGASAHGVVRGRVDRVEDRRRMEDALEEGPLLLQRYMPEVGKRGEWSVVHLGGAFSHAVRKTPAPGDFRVQERLGGTIRSADPPGPVRDLAERVVTVADGRDDLYARVDLIESAEGPRLIELELIEPSLFLEHGRGAPERFAEALAHRMEAG